MPTRGNPADLALLTAPTASDRSKSLASATVNPAKPVGHPSTPASVCADTDRALAGRVGPIGCGRGADVLLSLVLISKVTASTRTANASTATLAASPPRSRRLRLPGDDGSDSAATDATGRRPFDADALPPSQAKTAQPPLSCQQSACCWALHAPHDDFDTLLERKATVGTRRPGQLVVRRAERRIGHPDTQLASARRLSASSPCSQRATVVSICVPSAKSGAKATTDAATAPGSPTSMIPAWRTT
jgi:hypothetical protein